jgi:DNA-binding LytR/AlgR family response regulator
MALRTLIVDDEPLARQVLREELEETGGISIVGEAENGERALERIRTLAPELVLLDIQMPVLDGFEVLRRLRGPLPSIIFVTAFSEHALKAFEVGAADYLLKPVRAERLRQAVERVRAGRNSAVSVAATLNAERQASGAGLSKIVARKGRDYYLLDLDEIYAFQADGELVWILADAERYLATETLKALEEKLGAGRFQRVHRGALVNIEKIRKFTSVSSQRWLLTLTNGVQLTVSKRQAPLVRQLLSD